MAPATIPPYPQGRSLLASKTVLVTAAAGTGIGFATARRCAEEEPRSSSATSTSGGWVKQPTSWPSSPAGARPRSRAT